MRRRNFLAAASFFALMLLALALPAGVTPDASSAQTLTGGVAAADWRGKVDPRVLSALEVGQAEFLIYMRQQADLSGARALKGKEAKGRYVYERLTSTAATTQANVRRALAQFGATYRPFWVSNTIYAKGGMAVVQTVAALPEVAAVYPVGKGRLTLPKEVAAAPSANSAGGAAAANLADPSPEPGLLRVNADDVWALGYEGQGVVVAGADTGVRWTHAALKGHYRGWNGSAASHDYNWHDGINASTWPPNPTNVCGVTGSSPEPCDDDDLLGGGHGSHTVGSMVGDDGGANRIGMAPQAQWIACRNMSQGVGAIPSYLECMQWFIAPTKVDGTGPDPAKAPHVINNSWGCVEGCPPEPNPLRDSLKASRAAGIVYVASAGNDGPECNTIYHPLARYPEAFTVGSTTHTTDTISGFSSRGPAAADPENPTAPLYLKPNITAPGSSIRSVQRASDTAYGSLSGTSMAGPHVAGLVALVISANPFLAGDVDRIEEIIEQSAARKTTTEMCGLDSSSQVPNNTYGWGRIDALAAVQAALAAAPPDLVNYALATRGSVAAASSTYSSYNFSPESAFDGERTGGAWAQGGGWNDATRDAWPDSLEVTLGGGAKNIGEVRVYTLQDDFKNAQEPTPTMMATLYGITDFDVQYWDGSNWVTVPGGAIRGNNLVMRTVTFPPVLTTKVRVFVLGGREHFSRVVELEALGVAGQ